MKDKNHVYFFTLDSAEVIEKADPETFSHVWTEKETGACFYADENHLFDHEGAILTSFSSSSKKASFKDRDSYGYGSGTAQMMKIEFRKNDMKHLKYGIFTDGVEVFSLNWRDVFENADPKTFKILSKVYAKDKHAVYHYGDIEKKLDAKSFKMLGKKHSSLYMMDKKGIYWEYADVELKTVDPKTFQMVSKHYAKDKKRVFVHSEILKGADPATFRMLKDPEGNLAIAVDKDHVYLGNKVVKEINPGEIKNVKGSNSWLDSEYSYGLFYDKPLREIRLSKCKRIKASNLPAEEYYILDGSVFYTGDSESFCEGELIEEVYSKSFIAINEEYAKDKNYVYHEGVPITKMVYLNDEGEYESTTEEAYLLAQELYKKRITVKEMRAFLKASVGMKDLQEMEGYFVRLGKQQISAMAGAKTKIIRLNPGTLKMFSGSDGKDDKYYFRNESISIYRYYRYPDVDFETLQNLQPSWGPLKDKNNVYDSDFEIIEGVDPQTIEPVYDNREA